MGGQVSCVHARGALFYVANASRAVIKVKTSDIPFHEADFKYSTADGLKVDGSADLLVVHAKANYAKNRSELEVKGHVTSQREMRLISSGVVDLFQVNI